MKADSLRSARTLELGCCWVSRRTSEFGVAAVLKGGIADRR